MAVGDKWSQDRVAAVYLSDEAISIRFKVLERYKAQAQLGWDTVLLSLMIPRFPGLDPRSWLGYQAANHASRRRVPVGTNAAYIAGVIDTTTFAALSHATHDEQTFTLYGMEGQRSRGVERD